MDALFVDLLGALRRGGLRASTAETLDALAAAGAIGIESKEDLRIALGAALVKRAEDQARFERAFDAFFRIGARPSGTSETERAAIERRLMAAAQAAGAASGLGTASASDAELDAMIAEAMRESGVEQIQSPLQVGQLAMRTARALGLEALERSLPTLRDAADQATLLALAARIEAVRRLVRARVREELDRRNPDRLAQQRAARLEQTPLAALDRGELADVVMEVHRLGRLLRDRIDRRRRRARRGTLDVRGTMRASLRSAGIPLRIVMRKRRHQREKLVVLCDVSDSVRSAARFFLVLVHAIGSAFARTRSFLFVREVAESTELFRAHPAEQAVALAYSGTVLDVGASSDYGRALSQLATRHLMALDRRTTLIILGDGRSNHLDPGVPALRTIAERAKRIVWLNPEPRASWGFGDSAMQVYLPFCTFSATVASLGQLRAAMERLAERISR